MKRSVAIVTWWEGGEREISLKSAQTIFNHLDRELNDVTMFNLPSEYWKFIEAKKKLWYCLIFIIVYIHFSSTSSNSPNLFFVVKKTIFPSSLPNSGEIGVFISLKNRITPTYSIQNI